jgi:hypothetical protein
VTAGDDRAAGVLTSLAADIDHLAEVAPLGVQRTILGEVARLARERAESYRAGTQDAGTGDGRAGDAQESPEPSQAREDAIRYDERRKVLDAARSRTVQMTRADGQEVAAVQWSSLLEALGVKP